MMMTMKQENMLLCRVCLQCYLKDVPTSSIFDKSDTCFIYEKLNRIAEVNIKPKDGLPDKICAECLLELENAINFKQKCETSNSILLSAANAGDGLKGEEPIEEDVKVEPDEYIEHEYLEEDLESSLELTLTPVKTDDLEQCPSSSKVIPKLEKTEDQEQPQIQIKLPHKKSRAKDLQLECHDCGNLFKSKCKLKVHWFKVHLKTQLTCKICGKVFGSFKMIKDHKVNKTKKCITLSQVDISGEGKSRVMRCRECKYFTKSILYMTRHLGKHTGDAKLFICKLCPKKYLDNFSLKLHMELMHDAKKIEKTCATCGEVVIGISRYRQHMVSHRNTSVSCKICNKLIKKNNYIQHNMIVHSHERNYCCEQCGASFKGPATLYVHKNEVHKEENKFNCEKCGFSNNSQLKMNNHRRKHTDHEDFACDVCGKFLPNNPQLILHKKRHIARNYKCPQCDENFFRMASLKRHIIELHFKNTDKDQKASLWNDIELTFQKKRFVKNHKCLQCEAIYCRMSSLQKHIKRVH